MQIVEYVGKQISKEGITMSSKKIRGVTDFPMPRKTTELIERRIVPRTHQLFSGSCTKSLQRGSTTAQNYRSRREKSINANLDR